MVVETERLIAPTNGGVLADSPLVYFFIYVSDLARSRDFYENKLKLRVLEEDADSVKYDTGLSILCLNRATDYGITLAPGNHESTDIVFLVDDIDGMRAALMERGLTMGKAFRYDPGGICDFYDPDGHWLTLYEPNEAAMTWASADKIRAIWKAAGRGTLPVVGPAAIEEKENGEFRMDGKPLLYLFRFVREPQEAQVFYNNLMGLVDLEGGPCSAGSDGDEEGVIKYDAGGIMLTTHQTWPDRDPDAMEHPCPPRLLDPGHMTATAVAFHVDNIEEKYDALTNIGIPFQGGVSRSKIGAIAKFSDPSGHVYFLYQPSDEALGWPSGPKIEEILTDPAGLPE